MATHAPCWLCSGEQVGTGANLSEGTLVNSDGIMVEEPVLLTINQAAARLAICRRTLLRLVAGGKFPAPVKIGRAARVPVSDVRAYLARLMQARGKGPEDGQ